MAAKIESKWEGGVNNNEAARSTFKTFTAFDLCAISASHAEAVFLCEKCMNESPELSRLRQ